MTATQPGHLSPYTLSAALSRAAHGTAIAALICGFVVVLGFLAAYPDRVLWPALVSLVIMIPMLALVRRSRRVRSGVAYLAVGALAAYGYTLTFALQLPDIIEWSILWLAPPKIILILVAGAGVGLLRAITWILGGFVVAEGAVLLALSQAGMPALFDVLTLSLVAEALAVCLLAFVSLRKAERTHPRLQRAARDEMLDDLRARMELRAAALMHDTILSHLAAIANSSESRLPQQQKQQIERDLQILVGQEWLSAEPDDAGEGSSDELTSPLRDAITEVRSHGLEVVGTGDFASVLRLSHERSQALGLAAKQCLVNVIKHSGVMTAEVAVYASDEEVSVMIIDAGKGFSGATVGSDRMGLRTSVQKRIEDVGGAVQVWSTPGSGTSILLQVPAPHAEVPE